MNQAQMAQSMEKSESWVNRLKHAYEFALQFVEYVDDEEHAEQMAAKYFSTLEELSRRRSSALSFVSTVIRLTIVCAMMFSKW